MSSGYTELKGCPAQICTCTCGTDSQTKLYPPERKIQISYFFHTIKLKSPFRTLWSSGIFSCSLLFLSPPKSVAMKLGSNMHWSLGGTKNFIKWELFIKKCINVGTALLDWTTLFFRSWHYCQYVESRAVFFGTCVFVANEGLVRATAWFIDHPLHSRFHFCLHRALFQKHEVFCAGNRRAFVLGNAFCKKRFGWYEIINWLVRMSYGRRIQGSRTREPNSWVPGWGRTGAAIAADKLLLAFQCRTPAGSSRSRCQAPPV